MRRGDLLTFLDYSIICLFLYVTTCYASISGKVSDINGYPVSGILISFTDESEPSSVYNTYTDSDGRYEIQLTISLDEYSQTDLDRFTLYQNYPNPFNTRTLIQFSLGKACFVDLTIYNVLGQKVRTLLRGYQSAGKHNVTWNGLDDKGDSVGAGVFLYQLKSGGRFESKKMLLIDGGVSSLSASSQHVISQVLSLSKLMVLLMRRSPFLNLMSAPVKHGIFFHTQALMVREIF